MAPKPKDQRLFGAACVRVTLERTGRDPSALEIYRETLEDLEVTDEEVSEYLRDHRVSVERSLDAHGGDRGGRR